MLVDRKGMKAWKKTLDKNTVFLYSSYEDFPFPCDNSPEYFPGTLLRCNAVRNCRLYTTIHLAFLKARKSRDKLYPNGYNHYSLFYFIPDRVYYLYIYYIYTRKGINMPANQSIARFLKEKRQALRLTQSDLAKKAGVGLRFIRDLEQGKTSLRMDKVNQVLKLFGRELGLSPLNRIKIIDEKC